jgi:hypothetical protein
VVSAGIIVISPRFVFVCVVGPIRIVVPPVVAGYVRWVRHRIGIPSGVIWLPMVMMKPSPTIVPHVVPVIPTSPRVIGRNVAIATSPRGWRQGAVCVMAVAVLPWRTDPSRQPMFRRRARGRARRGPCARFLERKRHTAVVEFLRW